MNCAVLYGSRKNLNVSLISRVSVGPDKMRSRRFGRNGNFEIFQEDELLPLSVEMVGFHQKKQT